MTVQEIKDFIVQIDPEARHYYYGKPGTTFTVWSEVKLLGLEADDNLVGEGWRAAIMRFTTQENDAIAADFCQALLEDPRITLTDYSVRCNTETGYVMHAFTFEAA